MASGVVLINSTRIPVPDAALTRRLVTRFILEFGTTVVANATARFEGDVARGLIYFAIQLANVEHLARDEDLAWRYSAEVAPDNVRRPISVHALAQVLKFSPETTRRHVKALEAVGACERVAALGVIVPSRHITTPEMAADRQVATGAFDTLIAGLKSVGFPLPPPALRQDGGAQKQPPVFLVTRLINAYMMRMVIEAAEVYGDVITGTLFAAIMNANTRAITYDPVLAWRFAHGDNAPPDEARDPITITQLCGVVQMPYSTVHRHIGRMVKTGMVERKARGVIIPTSVAVKPSYDASGLRVAQWLGATFRDMAALGYDFSPLGSGAAQQQVARAALA